MKKICVPVFVAVALFSAVTIAHAAGRPITVTDLLSMPRISEPQISPDGARVIYAHADRRSANIGALQISRVSVGAHGAGAREQSIH